MLIVQDIDKKYFLDNGVLIVQDLIDCEDIVSVREKDFSDFERSTYKFLINN